MLKRSLREIGDFLKVEVLSDFFITSAAFDSRKVQTGGIFFALRGESHDGHDFLGEVASKGAVAAIVSIEYSGPDYGLILIPVGNVRESLQELGKWFHQQEPPFVLAVTGTVGKTTTKEFIAHLLEEKYQVARPDGSENSQLSLPLFLLNQKKSVDMLILEMGMSLPGEITRLVDIAPPDFGVLTKISLVHSENFDDLHAIASAKMELFQKTNVGLFNLETMAFPAVQQASLKKKFYSMKDPHADYYLKLERGQAIITERGNESPPLNVTFHASHLLENFLCAVAIARIQGLTWEEIQKGTSKLGPYTHRFHIFKRDGIQYVDDSYNASIVSMKAALDNLPKGKRRVALLGDMRELGKFSIRCHEEVAYHALNIIDHLLCIGNEVDPMIKIFKKAGKTVEKVFSIREAKQRLKEITEAGDVVLVKGANSLKLWNVLD